MTKQNSRYRFDTGLPQTFEYFDVGWPDGPKTIYGSREVDPADVEIVETGFGKTVTIVIDAIPDKQVTFATVFISTLAFTEGSGAIYALSQAIISKRSINLAGGSPLVGQITHFESVFLAGDAEMRK